MVETDSGVGDVDHHGVFARRLFWTLATITALLATGISTGAIGDVVVRLRDAFGIGSSAQYRVPSQLVEDIGMDGVILFKQHDINDDGFLSLREFEPIAHQLLDIKSQKQTVDCNSPIEQLDEVVTVETFFKPLLMTSLTKELSSDYTAVPGSLDPMAVLKKWKTPAVKWKNFATGHFRQFLPPLDEELFPGKCYYIVEPVMVEKGPSLSSNRYVPPRLAKESWVMVHSLLAMFHPVPFVYGRFAPQGSVACVQAFNSDYIDIGFRIHAEFQLNEPPYYPFWFTPGQFTGHVILSRNAGRLLNFTLYVPNDKRLNVDMEWLTDSEENMEVDIGFMPRMELRVTRSSIPAKLDGVDIRSVHINASSGKPDDTLSTIKWTDEVSEEETARSLEVKLFPFKKVPYYNLSEAFTRARAEKKLVHSIVLWGALDDQSC